MKQALFALMALSLALVAPAAAADDLEGMEMDVMDAGGTPNEASTKVLALPDEASDTAREHAQKGLDTANSARDDGRALGEDTADAAREARGDAGGDHGPPDDPGRP